MARIIVTTDGAADGTAPVFLEESVHPVHLSTEHAALQLIERLTWALDDAEAAEGAEVRRRMSKRARPARRPPRALRATATRAA